MATLRRPLWEKLAVASRLAVHPWSRKAGVYREKGFGFDSDVLSLGDGTCLIGFFQSEKYFKDIEPCIQNHLRLKQPLCDEDALRWTAGPAAPTPWASTSGGAILSAIRVVQCLQHELL